MLIMTYKSSNQTHDIDKKNLILLFNLQKLDTTRSINLLSVED